MNVANLLLFLLLLPFSLTPTVARADGSLEGSSQVEISRFRTEILDLRVRELLVSRLSALRACVRREMAKGAPPLSLVPHRELIQSLKTSLRARATGVSSEVISDIGLFEQSEHFATPALCRSEIAIADSHLREIERRPFKTGATALILATAPLSPVPLQPLASSEVAQILGELDPWCVQTVSKSYTGYHESNPCFAGTSLTLSAVTSRRKNMSPELVDQMERFVVGLSSQVDSAPPASEIDLWKKFNDYGTPDGNSSSNVMLGKKFARRTFLAVLSILSTSNTSAAGYVDGYGDFSWRSTLRQTSSPDAAFQAFERRKSLIDLFSTLAKKSQAKGIRLTVNHSDTANAYRHNVTSAFLACQYAVRGEKSLALIVPSLAGIAYEAKDFESHLREGVSLERSIENFRVDTERYVSAAKWGSEFCMKP